MKFSKKSIPENSPIERSPNDFTSHKNTKDNTDRLVKRITDALVQVDGGKYHFECESKNDGEILIRIADYDMQIALNEAEYNNHSINVELPDTAVIYLRKHRKLPNEGIITYTKNGKSLVHHVPYYEISNYGLDYLAEKHLYVLFPFYLMRYEHAIANNTSSKFLLIENEANRVYNILTKTYDENILSEKEYEDILTLCSDVVKEMSKGSQLAERLVEIMGNEVLKTAEERGLDKGLKALVSSLKKHYDNFQSLYREVISNEEYKNYTEEQVKKYY